MRLAIAPGYILHVYTSLNCDQKETKDTIIKVGSVPCHAIGLMKLLTRHFKCSYVYSHCSNCRGEGLTPPPPPPLVPLNPQVCIDPEK